MPRASISALEVQRNPGKYFLTLGLPPFRRPTGVDGRPAENGFYNAFIGMDIHTFDGANLVVRPAIADHIN